MLFNLGFECGLRTERVENAYASLGSVGSGDAAVHSDRASWKRSRRVQRYALANRSRCDCVILRWREGFIFSAHRSSADNISCCDRLSVNGVGEVCLLISSRDDSPNTTRQNRPHPCDSLAVSPTEALPIHPVATALNSAGKNVASACPTGLVSKSLLAAIGYLPRVAFLCS
jgi:hypothetical protein